MIKYTVYQIAKSEKSDPRGFDAMIDGSLDVSFFKSAYKAVCEIEAVDLNHVFEIGNIGPDEKIRRFDFQPMHSISVGDVIYDELLSEYHVVQGLGFKRLEGIV